MKLVLRAGALVLLLGAGRAMSAQEAPRAVPSRAQVIVAAREIMRTARYCTLVTLGADGQPQARIVDPFPPDSDLVIWIATNPLTRKVGDIRRDGRVTLLYFNAAASEYVTVVGTAVADTDPAQKISHWKPEWSGIYQQQNRGDDYLLLRVKPSRLEVSATGRGVRNDPLTWQPTSIAVP